MAKPLSKEMLNGLLALHRAPDSVTLGKGTIKALIARSLLDTNENLTHLGSITAIQCLPLKEQCRSIGIELTQSTWNASSRPEKYALNIFREQGYVGTHCEGGGFGAAIKALCLDALTEASIFFGTCIDAREDACLKDVVCLSHLEAPKLEMVLNQIQHRTKAEYLLAFSEIMSYRLIGEWCPSLNLEFADALFDAVPKSDFVRLARWISKDHCHRNGWPDLTLVKDGRLKFVEVKTTDRMHHSQLITIPALVREIAADVSVLQLVRQKSLI